jgi:hypothetical protein
MMSEAPEACAIPVLARVSGKLLGMQTVAVKRKGDMVGEIAFFFRLRHITAASIGKAQATLFALSHDDYHQLSATYIDDATKLIESLTRTVEAQGPAGKSQASSGSKAMSATSDMSMHDAARVRKIIDAAVRRQTENHVITFVEAAANNDVKTLTQLLDDGVLDIDEADYGALTVFVLFVFVCVFPGIHILCNGAAGLHAVLINIAHDCVVSLSRFQVAYLIAIGRLQMIGLRCTWQLARGTWTLSACSSSATVHPTVFVTAMVAHLWTTPFAIVTRASCSTCRAWGQRV